MRLKVNAKIMNIGNQSCEEEKSLNYDYNDSSTMQDLFTYITEELHFINKDGQWYFPGSLGKEADNKIFNATTGKIDSNGQISWDFSLEEQKIVDVLTILNLDPSTQGLDVLCQTPTGTGGGIQTLIEAVKVIFETFGPILGYAADIATIVSTLKAFSNFSETERGANSERIIKTIKTKEKWRYGFSSTKTYEGKELVEEKIMEYMEYNKNEEKKEWTRGDMG